MSEEQQFLSALRRTRILRPPKHHLATFGTTTFSYVLLSPLQDPTDACRLREGQVTAERPKILTPDHLRERFDGFGEESRQFQEFFERSYGSALHGLEYQFKNELRASSVEHTPLPDLVARTRDRMDSEDAPRKALLESPDHAWGLAVMKFIVETSLKSFPGNIKELDERGFFNPEGRKEAAERREIERLFQQAHSDRSAIQRLGDYLRKSGFFAEYEDRFFALIQR